ncbi:MAG: AMP-binding protein, partial [Oscillospiraceae bacterium]|nr:AMP-binding protein [Oscillospiraceae bacterium]
MENNLRVMERLKGLRNELGFSAADMASAVNLSEKEFLAVESGEADASFTFLYKCADKLGVDLASIVTGDEPRLSEYTLSRKEDGMPIKRRECFDYSHLAYLFKDRLAEPFVVTAKYSQETENSPIALANHNGQELNYVLEGELKVHIDGHEELLHPGDSVYYQGKQLHGMVAAGGRDCKFLAVVIKGAADEDIEPIEAPASQKAGVGADDGRFYKKFTKETFDKNGMLTDIGFDFADNFNFSYDVVDELAKKNPEKLAMMWVSHGEDRRFTFGDMAKYSSKAANYFKSLGIKKGDKVMLVLRRHYQFWYAVLGLHKIGAVGIPATDQLMAKDFVYRFKTAHIRAIVCTGYGEVAKMAEDAMADSPTVEIKMMANGVRDGWDNFDGGVEKASDVFERVETNVKDPMLMYFTSGTTGYPKITVMDYSYALAHIMTARWWQNVKEDGLHFTVADTGWAKAMWGKLYGQWLCEAAVFTYDYEKMIPADLLPMFKKYGITTFCAPPTIYRFFIKEDLTKFDLSSLKYAVIAGEALNPEVYQQFYAATGLKLMEGYGQTEMVIAVANIPGMEPKPGSMGKPVPGYTFHLLGPDGNQVKTGETGEMCVY